MPREMPPLASAFAATTDTAVGIAQAGETIRGRARPGSVEYSALRGSRLEALYEMAYLKVFIGWEILLEETFLRLMCGYEIGGTKPTFAGSHRAFGSIPAARTALYNGRDYLLWHNPMAVAKRCQEWFVNGIHSQVVASQVARLQSCAAVRHRIAHGSDQAKRAMDSASMQLSGRRYPASSAGRFLRDWKADDPMVQERWLRVITNELTGLGYQLAP